MFDAKIGKLVVHGARDQRLQPAANQNVGRGLAGQLIVSHTDPVITPRGDGVADVRSEHQSLIFARAGCRDLDGDKRRVVDRHTALFHGRNKVVLAIRFTVQNRGKQRYQRFAANWRAMVKPCPVTRDAHIEITTDCRLILDVQWNRASTQDGCRRTA